MQNYVTGDVILLHGVFIFATATIETMTKRKEACPDCCAYTITFSPSNCDYIWETLDARNLELKKQRKRKISIETFVNEILTNAREQKT